MERLKKVTAIWRVDIQGTKHENLLAYVGNLMDKTECARGEERSRVPLSRRCT